MADGPWTQYAAPTPTAQPSPGGPPPAGPWAQYGAQPAAPTPAVAQPVAPVQPYAAQPATPATQGLPHPDLVNALTSQHAQTLATAVLAPEPPPTAPTFRNPRTGRSYQYQPPGQTGGPLGALDMPITGGQKIVAGAQQMAAPGVDPKFAGASQMLRGGFEAATPFMLPMMAEAPLVTGASLGVGMASQEAVEAGLKKIGLPPGLSAFAGDIAGVIAGMGTHKVSAKAASALGAKYGPILKARSAAAMTPAPPEPAGTATITGRVPYQPPAEPTATDATKTATKPPVQTVAGQPQVTPAPPTQTLVATPAPKAVYPKLSDENLKHLLKFEPNPEKRAEYVAAARQRGMTVPAATPEKETHAPAPTQNLDSLIGDPGSATPQVPFGESSDDPRYIMLPRGHRRIFNPDGSVSFVSPGTAIDIRRADEDAAHVAATPAPSETAPETKKTKKAAAAPETPPAQPTIGEPSDGKQRTAAVDAGTTGTVDAGRTGEGSALHGATTPGARSHAGRKVGAGEATSVLVPGEDRSIPAHYDVRELSEIQASHNGQTFSANPDYQGQNERDYSKPENQQRVIEQSSEERFEPRYHVTDNPDLGNGPPLIDVGGNALGGNSRTMQLQRVYGRDGAKAAGYRALLEKRAAQFGIDPAVVRGMRQPVLVRVATPEGLEALPGGSKWAVRKTNITGTAALSASERAAADAGQMSPDMITHIAGAIEASGPDATLNDALTGASGTRIVNDLVANGFFSEQERPALMDGKTGVLTQGAKDRIAKALVGKFFRNSDQIARTPASVKNKLERVAAPLAKVAGNPDWDITPDVREAIDLLEHASAHDIKNLNDVVNQTNMFGEAPKWPDGVVKLAQLLRDGKPNDVVNAFRKYVNSKEPTMFGESTSAEAFADAFGAEKPASMPKQGTQSIAPQGSPEVGPHGPIFREFVDKPDEGLAWIRSHETGVAPGVIEHDELGRTGIAFGVPGDPNDNFRGGYGIAHIDAKHEGYLTGENLRKIAHMPIVERSYNKDGSLNSAVVAEQRPDGEHRAILTRDFRGTPTDQWLVSAYRRPPAPRTSVSVPGAREGAGPTLPATGGQRNKSSFEKIRDASEGRFPRAGGTTPPPEDQSRTSSIAGADPHAQPKKLPPESSASHRGPVTMGAGLGAFEPFLRESIEDMRALKAKRDAALEALERSKITEGQKKWGEQVRHYFTSERDVWAARANQAIAKARKLTLPSRNRRTGVDLSAEAVAIAREFKRAPAGELQSILDGTHPDLAKLDTDDRARVTARIEALRPAIERAIAAPDAAMKAVDQFYTNMAQLTGIEGRRVGNLDATWNPETYVPHILHPKGEGAVATPRKVIGQALGGRIGKYFGFSQERSYPSLLHAIMADVIPKTMNVHDAFTIQQDHFARSRATRLLEDTLRDTDIGKYTVKASAPEGWVPIAPQSNEFRALVPYNTGTIDEAGEPVLDVAEKRMYVAPHIEQALRPITSPDFTTEIVAVHALRVSQAATKAAQLGLSFFHATTENYMALANMGPKGWVRALRADRDSPEFLKAERDLIAHGGTTSIQGNTVEAYRAMQPGSIPTYGDIWRQNAAVKIMDQAANAISDFTFANLQRRFKVTDYQLHTAAWMAENPGASGRDVTLAKQSIAKEVNAIYGGLHWENIGLNKSTVEIARAIMLAPDWTLSNIFNVKYAFEKSAGGRMARMFWLRTLVGGLIATQAASLMFSGKHSKRPTMVYMGHDSSGREIYQNIFFKGAPGDVTNLVTNIYDYGLQGIVRTLAGKGAPAVRTALQVINNRDYLGHEIAPRGMNPLASSARTAWAAGKSMLPIPLSFTNQADMLFGPESHKYKLAESLTTMFSGNPPSHVAPAGTHMSGGVLRPNAPREENSALDQTLSGSVYKKRGTR